MGLILLGSLKVGFYERFDRKMPLEVNNLITFGSPHLGVLNYLYAKTVLIGYANGEMHY